MLVSSIAFILGLFIQLIDYYFIIVWINNISEVSLNFMNLNTTILNKATSRIKKKTKYANVLLVLFENIKGWYNIGWTKERLIQLGVILIFNINKLLTIYWFRSKMSFILRFNVTVNKAVWLNIQIVKYLEISFNLYG